MRQGEQDDIVTMSSRSGAQFKLRHAGAGAHDLEAIAASDEAPVRALHGWRAEVFGNDALALKHGQLALTAGKNRIELVKLPERGA